MLGRGRAPVARGRAADHRPRPARLLARCQSDRAVLRRDPQELLTALGDHETVTVPTTYLWGSGDPALGRNAAEATGDHVSGDYRFVEMDAGHWLPELHPADVAEAVLDRVRRTT